MDERLEIALAAGAELGEGPVWDDRTGTLLWVDILQQEVHRYDPATGQDTSVCLPEPVGAVVTTQRGDLLVAVGMSFARCDERNGDLSKVASVRRGDRMNDGACDPAGRFWAGTMSNAQTPGASSLYVLDPAGGVSEAISSVTLSNGLAWSPAGDVMYYIDTPLERVDAFDYDPGHGSLSRRRTIVDLRDAAGRPDGLTVDADGRLWIAMARAGCVRCHAPSGRLEHLVEVPAPLVTSCAFGGTDLADLYITTGRWSMSPQQLIGYPAAGSLFRVRDLGIKGLPAMRYAG